VPHGDGETTPGQVKRGHCVMYTRMENGAIPIDVASDIPTDDNTSEHITQVAKVLSPCVAVVLLHNRRSKRDIYIYISIYIYRYICVYYVWVTDTRVGRLSSTHADIKQPTDSRTNRSKSPHRYHHTIDPRHYQYCSLIVVVVIQVFVAHLGRHHRQLWL
jgi:hypothetical protein